MYKTFLTERDVSAIFRVSIETLRRWRALKMGPRFIHVGRAVRYRPEDLDQYLGSRPAGGENVRTVTSHAEAAVDAGASAPC